MRRTERGKPRVHDEDGVKDGENREDSSRQDKRPRPVGPATGSIDKAMSEGLIEPDPDTPAQTPRD